MVAHSYEYDIFIAYAFKEDRPRLGVPKGWVTRFQSFLQTYLETHLLRPEIFRSRGGAFNADEEIKRVLDNSAVLVIITSPFFVKREWFRKEYSWFVQAVERDGGSTFVTDHSGRKMSRIFMVLKTEVSEKDLPDEMRDFKGYDFSTHLFVPGIKLHEGVYSLANDIIEVLGALRTD